MTNKFDDRFAERHPRSGHPERSSQRVVSSPSVSSLHECLRLKKTSKKEISQKSSVGNADVRITTDHAASWRAAHEVVICPTGKRTDSNGYEFFSMFFNEIHFFSHVLIPKGEYNGQKETRLVNKNTAPRNSKVFPKNPETASVKNKYAKTIAATTRIPRSKFPMFFFIVLYFLRRWGWMVEGFVTYITTLSILRINHLRWSISSKSIPRINRFAINCIRRIDCKAIDRIAIDQQSWLIRTRSDITAQISKLPHF